MYATYPGRDLYSDVYRVVDKAFHKLYTYSEYNSFDILSIVLDYTTIESELDVPDCKVKVGCSTTCDENFNFKFDYYLDMSNDFNLGVVYASLLEALG